MLGVTPIGVNHNFFDLGGHSLLAIRVMSRIREATGRGIQLAAIFNGPTVGQLAGFLDRYVPEVAGPGLIEIQGATERPRLYLVPGVGEGNAELSRLARAIGRNQSVWGFRFGAASGIGTSIEETAAAYVNELLRAEPAGPYLIGGWSFGAIVAFEMARQLQTRNKCAGLVLLFDMVAPSPAGIESILAEGWANEAELMASVANEITRGAAGATPAELQHLPSQEMLEKIVYRIKSSNAIPADVPPDALAGWLLEMRDWLQALRHYRPRSYPGRLVLFRATRLPANNPAFAARLAALGPALGWDRFSEQEVEVHRAGGSHYTMFDTPFVDALGAEVRKLIAEASTNPDCAE
jgi:thioesterase domain-containing protein